MLVPATVNSTVPTSPVARSSVALWSALTLATCSFVILPFEEPLTRTVPVFAPVPERTYVGPSPRPPACVKSTLPEPARPPASVIVS